MIGILVVLAISSLLLFFLEKKSILALGICPTSKRVKQFCIGFLITGFLCVLNQVLESYLKSSIWIVNENISAKIIIKSFWWDVKSVLTEELIYRGAILYILINKIGSKKSMLISAVVFGIYHWFSYGVFGNLLVMLIVFIGTGLMGYTWAWAFSKTKSVMLPFGLHLGWNFINNTVFSKGPLGDLIFVSHSGNTLAGWASLLNFTSDLVLVPIIVFVYVRYLVKEETAPKDVFTSKSLE
jgi:membrane protease YdiL (CAAX protease family)